MFMAMDRFDKKIADFSMQILDLKNKDFNIGTKLRDLCVSKHLNY